MFDYENHSYTKFLRAVILVYPFISCFYFYRIHLERAIKRMGWNHKSSKFELLCLLSFYRLVQWERDMFVTSPSQTISDIGISAD